jgi:toxin-antitoxin system PIN domain toxin
MILIDVNVLVYAHRADAPGHPAYREWLEALINGDPAYGFSELVLSGFLKVVTHPRVFNPPSRLDSAFAFAQTIRSQPNAVLISPGPRHWEIFKHLCEVAGVKGNLVPDAYLAALAIESGSEWISTDRDYSRFPGLKWRHPLITD